MKPVPIRFPKCTTCGTDSHIRRCPNCGIFTCPDCVRRLPGNKCIHAPYVVPNLPRW